MFSPQDYEYQLRNGKIEIKIKGINLDLYDYLKKTLNFKWVVDHWEGFDDAINRALLDIPLPEVKAPDIDFGKFEMLRNYQKNDVARMVALGSCLNANEMGLGKTLEAIVYTQYMFYEKILIVCPKSLMDNWGGAGGEFEKWEISEAEDIAVVRGQLKQKKKQIDQLNLHMIVVVNYDLLNPRYTKEEKRKPSKAKIRNELLVLLKEFYWDIIIGDEIHKIKNSDAGRTIGLKMLQSTYRVGLSGTPIENYPDELWSILNWINPFYSGNSYWRFVNLFCKTYDNGYGIKPIGLTEDEHNRKALQKILDHIMIRNEKRAVFPELPPKQFQDIKLEMSDKQLELYFKTKTEILFELENGKDMVIPNAVTRLTRLLQITSNPELFGIKGNPKFDAALDIIEGTDKKILFFSRFEETISAFSQYLNDNKIEHLTITGKTRDPHGNEKKFQTTKSIKVIAGTIQCMAEGFTLDEGEIVVFFDKWWNPKKNEQCEDRAYGRGIMRSVLVLSLIMKNSMDLYVEKVNTMKLEDIKLLLK